MNLQHLYYALEVERTGSITQAAENLYMGQPNLSRAIRELESSLGMPVFRRSSRGIVPTDRGRQFLRYARSIVDQVERAEAIFRSDSPELVKFRVAATHTSDFARAFTQLVSGMKCSGDIELEYRETDVKTAVELVSDGVCAIALVRAKPADSRFLRALGDKGVASEQLGVVNELVTFASGSALDSFSEIGENELSDLSQICLGDNSLRLPRPAGSRDALTRRRILVTDRYSCFAMLSKLPESYCFLPPTPEHELQRFGLRQRPYSGPVEPCRDYVLRPEEDVPGPASRELIELVKKNLHYGNG